MRFLFDKFNNTTSCVPCELAGTYAAHNLGYQDNVRIIMGSNADRTMTSSKTAESTHKLTRRGAALE